MMGSPGTEFDVVVVGSGPNGLSAGIRLQQAGLSVLILEGKDTIGGGTRSAELTLPGYTHDVCSAIHPLAAGSPFFSTLPLKDHGLEFITPPVLAAHPLDDGETAALYSSLSDTAQALGRDEDRYRSLLGPLVADWDNIASDVLGPLTFPKDPVAFARFGMKALTPSTYVAKKFKTREGRALWAGMAAHSIQPLTNVATSAIALVLLIAGHTYGWPFPKGGSQQIANALASCLQSLGGKIETNATIRAMSQLPSAKAVVFDVTPRQLLEIAGHKFTSLYRWQLRRYRYGMGVFKIDWALDGPTPFTSEVCRNAGTVHLGNTLEEIAAAEQMVWQGQHPDKPFVLFAQQSLFDPSRAPKGKHTAWAYCHVPQGSEHDMTVQIEQQVERFAPGFRDRILARHTMTAAEMSAYNPNYVGGDINGGVNDIGQIFTRPALRFSPYRTSANGIYICSSSTPPGGGVHGMCGVRAAEVVIRDLGIEG
ncbi:MAG: NAD(P)/FAD-dependent oxidoreductase [Bacteroidota bacterium]|nr:NAD(P)/FAD-dependent oxidoreductase [Bacteroidota bacterium]